MSSIVIAGGGTTGHVSPMLALGRALRRRHPDVRVLMVGTAEGLEARLVPEAGFDFATIARVPMPRKPSGAALRFPGRFAGTIRDMRRLIAQSGADAVVGVGGYVSTPAYLAARSMRVPIVVHEANFRPGLANRVGALLSDHVACAFPGTPLSGARPIGMPMRTEISQLDRAAARPEAAVRLGLDPALPTLAVTGGSLGAARLNAGLAAAREQIAAAGVQVVHLTGAGKDQPVREALGDLPRYHVLEYASRMEDVYAVADLIIARAGAGTVSEVTAVGLPAVYVPLPIGNGEQRLNARSAVEAGAATLVDDADFDGRTVAELVLPLLQDPRRLAAMTAASGTLPMRDADERLADMVDDAIEQGRRPGGRDRTRKAE
ncbi:undecaprenyldiphospho-muramoylpentapeptide beta-N-acetylglucosaminyltransferase [Sediminivirga luteola]|uniref:UDP-N-acetylglucosamine--N-acetylmuramyl-(pentapeptide) pyrophosphoryl-undecaprenol N-acetylglucosamine transferase n=1 Tax=Sediminivirga luteola TaxID=1774748 RepID=A0A8J2TZU5_9MICO|nr:undecaprenyldiphospho-muramoylpentapeptide beta-N-acetylglucosaminyltransferase [Sediminivirga luteola]GGA21081.1 UDP-N-acetylglucosamine--N-acetylmuramyl-(pentapeptide) pyrophosphoryl-undecaprenol N-acetylglucosamine transferase [Sediminivirga luteola]